MAEEETNEELEVIEPEDTEIELTDDNIGEVEKKADEPDEKIVETEFVVSIEGEKSESEEEQAKDPNWLKNLRKENREMKKKQKEMELKLAEKENKEKTEVEIGKRPTLGDSDIDYDTNLYEKRLADWIERKRLVDEKKVEQEKASKQQQLLWEDKLTSYNEGKKAIPVKDMDDIEDLVKTHLSLVQQSMIVRCAKNPALLVYAIGKNEATLKKIAKITDYAEFAYTLGELENKLKTSNKQVPDTQPEKKITGSGSKSVTSVDKQLEKLREEALKTGDMSKVHAYKRNKRKG